MEAIKNAITKGKQVTFMPNIKPISDLRNYTEVLKEVDADGCIYLTRNGHGAYAIVPITVMDELERLRTVHAVLADLKRSEEQANIKGWIDAADLEKELGI